MSVVQQLLAEMEEVTADRRLRDARIAAHAALDPFWRSPKNLMRNERRRVRSNVYRWLALRMRLRIRECHIKLMTIEQCAEVVRLCEERRARDARRAACAQR